MYKELVERLRAGTYTVEELSIILPKAADAIEELSKEKWIPVTERVPEKHERVLVRSKLVKMRTDFINNDGSWYTTPAVTHWMPLPEPPKEATEDV